MRVYEVYGYECTGFGYGARRLVTVRACNTDTLEGGDIYVKKFTALLAAFGLIRPASCLIPICFRRASRSHLESVGG